MRRFYPISTITIYVFMIVSILIIPSLSQAENKAGSVTLSIFGSGYLYDHEAEIGNPATHADLDNRFGGGLGIGFNITQNWGVEAAANNIWGKFDKQGTLSHRSIQTDLYHLDLLYHFMLENSFVAYVAAGIGWISHNPAAHELDRINEPLVNYGLGLKFFVTPSVALRGDVRRVLTYASSSNYITNNLLYNLGLTFAFGGGEKAKEAEVTPSPAPEPAPH